MGTKRGEFFEMCTSLHCLKLGESVIGLFKFISGGRPKGSKRNLKFQSTTWPQAPSQYIYFCCLPFRTLELL
jgi:hypothetical protein